MQLEWKKAESHNAPVEVDYISSKSSVFLRKNIEKINENEITKYKYDEAVITEPHFIYHDINNVGEYLNKLLAVEKEKKLSELETALEKKHQDKKSTLTFNLPATLKKGEEVKQVSAYKLLTVTSAGLLSTVLMGLNMLAATMDIQDTLVTDDGYTIVGLNEPVALNGINVKQIAIILAKYSELTAVITETFRKAKDAIANAQTLEELEDLNISFENI